MAIERVKTNIPGFDKLCEGGFIRNSVNLLSGGPGTGKTIFAMQFLYEGIQQGEKGLFISLEEDLNDLKEDAKIFGWDFDDLEKKNKCKFIYIYPYELSDFQAQLINEIKRVDAKRVIVDSTSVFGMALENEYEVRKQLYTFASQLKRLNCTTILTSEIVGEQYGENNSPDSVSRFGVEEFVADSVITLHYGGFGGAGDRAIRILKMRRTNHSKGIVPLEITSKGIKITGKEKGYK